MIFSLCCYIKEVAGNLVWYVMVWCGMYGMVGVVRYGVWGMVWYGVVWYGMV